MFIFSIRKIRLFTVKSTPCLFILTESTEREENSGKKHRILDDVTYWDTSKALPEVRWDTAFEVLPKQQYMSDKKFVPITVTQTL